MGTGGKNWELRLTAYSREKTKYTVVSMFAGEANRGVFRV